MARSPKNTTQVGKLCCHRTATLYFDKLLLKLLHWRRLFVTYWNETAQPWQRYESFKHSKTDMATKCCWAFIQILNVSWQNLQHVLYQRRLFFHDMAIFLGETSCGVMFFLKVMIPHQLALDILIIMKKKLVTVDFKWRSKILLWIGVSFFTATVCEFWACGVLRMGHNIELLFLNFKMLESLAGEGYFFLIN